jgi:hypothetical protein
LRDPATKEYRFFYTLLDSVAFKFDSQRLETRSLDNRAGLACQGKNAAVTVKYQQLSGINWLILIYF